MKGSGSRICLSLSPQNSQAETLNIMENKPRLPHAMPPICTLAAFLCLMVLDGCQKAKEPAVDAIEASTIEPPKVTDGRTLEFPPKMARISSFKTVEAKAADSAE